MSGEDSNGGRSLGGSNNNNERLPTAWAQPRNTQPRVGRIGAWSGATSSTPRSGGRMATMRDITEGGGSSGSGPAGGGGGHHRHANSDEDDDDVDDEDDKGPQDFFAGGERSGLSVQQPGRRGPPGGEMVRDFLRRATEAGAGPPGQLPTTAATSTLFSGGGHTLGSDEVDSQFIPDPNVPSDNNANETPAVRHLTFWSDGFSVEDGELLRYDDPENERILAEINHGHAAPAILNVVPGQPVELRVTKRLNEPYQPSQKSQSAAFSGAGQRLGAPVPNIAGAGSSTSPSTTSSTSNAPAPAGTRFEVDPDLPQTSVQVRLADGTRMVCRMNLTHQVSDLRNFINASRPENSSTPFTIGTAFPNRILTDDDQTIEQAGLKNAVVVQRLL